MRRKYPTLLPAPPPAGPESSSSSQGQSQSSPIGGGGLLRRKRVGTQIACSGCRSKKTRCNGDRPCSACAKRQSECTYPEPTNDNTAELLGLLGTVPEEQAFALLRSFRAIRDPAAVLSNLKGGTKDKQSQSQSEVSTELASTLSRDNALERELMIVNPVSYPTLRPPSGAELAESSLLQPSQSGSRNPYQNRKQSTSLPEYVSSLPDRDSAADSSSTGPPSTSSAAEGPLSPTSPTVHVYCDERLRFLDIRLWTDVQVTNELAARAISLYLETDHPLLGVFDPDLFITDLISSQPRFCSRALVHAVLFWGCQMHSAFDKGADVFADAFCERATKLWEADRTTDSLVNIAGAVLLSLSFMGRGMNHAVLEYAAEAAHMSARMGLFGIEDAPPVTRANVTMSPELQRASCYAAWGAFNWTVLMSLFYRQPGIKPPKDTPTVPMPGSQRSNTAHAALWGRDLPQPESELSRYMGTTFPALCEFWQIIHGVTRVYYPDGKKPPLATHNLAFAELKFRELIAWAENLPSSLVRGEFSPHHVVILHMWLHASILDIFRPFLKHQPNQDHQLRTFVTRGGTADAAYKASVNQLKRLVVDYRTSYESSTYTILWHTALTYLANAAMQNTDDPEWHQYFLLCIYGYQKLRRPYRIAEAIAQGLLAMVLRESDMSGGEARELLSHMKEQGTHEGETLGVIRATFMADLELAMTDPDGARVESLAARFEDMAVFSDFINADPDTLMRAEEGDVD